ncbi:MAG: metalloregulator ArsR/SmtB family transcription factor [Alphaproteobacteria bacterium]|nr:metalloregulator ArsR/SmtB family transcription factor [Alphaproteobacteria bacterium]
MSLAIETPPFEDLVLRLRAAAEPTRLRLLALLAEGELTVSEITHVLGQSQPRVSRHLKLLVDAGLVQRFPEGSWAFFRLADRGNAARVADSLRALLPESDAVLDADRRRLTAVRAARAEAAGAYFQANAENWAKLRALHVPEAEVERALIAMLADRPIVSLLDLGTGTGRMLELFGPSIGRGVGVDLSHAMLAVARNALADKGLAHCTVRQGDLLRLALGEERFDVALFHQVLHYLDTPALAVREAARVLAPGGRIVIADFAPHDLEFLRAEHAHRRLGFARGEIAEWARGAGLTVSAETALPPVAAGGLTVSLWRLEPQAQSGAPS